MCELRSLNYRLVISKSVQVASSLKKGWQYGTVRKYGTPQFLLKSSVCWYGTPFLKWYGYGTLQNLKYGTLVRYGFRCEVRSAQILNVPYRTAILDYIVLFV